MDSLAIASPPSPHALSAVTSALLNQFVARYGARMSPFEGLARVQTLVAGGASPRNRPPIATAPLNTYVSLLACGVAATGCTSDDTPALPAARATAIARLAGAPAFARKLLAARLPSAHPLLAFAIRPNGASADEAERRRRGFLVCCRLAFDGTAVVPDPFPGRLDGNALTQATTETVRRGRARARPPLQRPPSRSPPHPPPRPASPQIFCAPVARAVKTAETSQSYDGKAWDRSDAALATFSLTRDLATQDVTATLRYHDGAEASQLLLEAGHSVKGAYRLVK